MRTLLTASLVLLASLPASAGLFEDCDQQAPRTAVLSTAGATRVVVVGRAGSLKVKGSRGARDVRATGVACASDRDFLGRIRLTATRVGTTVRLEAEIPEWSGIGFHQASLDMDVVVPAELPLVVEDGSGDTKIEDVGPLDVTDGSGDLEIRNVAGDLAVEDGSGDLIIRNVRGAIRLRDGSGDIDIDGAGAVTVLADGSGELEARNIRGSVVVEHKGSGEIHVADVGGDFRVGDRRGRHVSYERVAGHVDLGSRRDE